MSDIQNISKRPSNKDKFIVRGDFNIPGTMWSLEEKLNSDGLLELSLSHITNTLNKYFTVPNAQCSNNYLNCYKVQFAQDPKQFFFNFVNTMWKIISCLSTLLVS